MTIDERLEKLVGRHEALSESVELLRDSMRDMQLANERRFQQNETHIAAIDERLRRAIELSVREARLERKRRSEADEKIDQSITRLAAAQLVTEEKIQRLADALLRTGKNGGTH